MVSFNAYGHQNIKGTHKNTIEFTKEKELTLQGDCILGVNSDFDSEKIRKFISGKEKIKVKITVDNVSDEFECIPNPKFSDKKEMVFRLGEFASERTLGLRATKACRHIKREIAEKMKEPGKKMKVVIE
jgi:hypothetical protein